MTIEKVLADQCFYRFSGCSQASGKMTSMFLWNPENSGVACAIRKSLTWSSNGTEFNYKWRTQPHGTLYSKCNSLSLKASGIAQSQSEAWADKTGWNGAFPDTIGYVLLAADRQACDIDFAPPVVLNPGTGLLLYPDTTAAINWTWAVFFEEVLLM